MERAAQHRQFAAVIRPGAERRDGRQAVVQHLARLFQEDILQVVLVEFGDLGTFRPFKRRRAGDLGCPAVGRAAELLDRRHRLFGLGCQRGQAHRDLCVDFFGAQHGIGAHHRCRRCSDGRFRNRRLGCRFGPALPAHQRLELAGLGIEHEQPLGQRRLVTQHVVQEAQCAEVVAERIEVARAAFRRINGQQALDVVAHALHRQRGLVQTQHREHTAHLQQLARDGPQQALFGRPTEELVERFLELAQVHAQLVDHGPHGLAVTHAAIQLLHPGLERLGASALARAFDAPGQLNGAGGELTIVRVEVFERGFEVQHRGGDLHRQLGRRRLARTQGRIDRVAERLGHRQARRVELLQRLGELREGIDRLAHSAHVAAGQHRPHFLGRLDALARLR